MFEIFPFSKLEALKFDLLSLPFVYETISEVDCQKLLTRNGDFVIELTESNVLHLYLRSRDEKIDIFLIKFCVISKPSRIGFSFGGKDFTTLPGLVSYFCKTKFISSGEKLRLKHAIYRKQINGSFGHGKMIKISDKKKVYIRSLNPRIAAHQSVEEILEGILLLSHKNICQVMDFDVAFRGEAIPPVILLKSEYYASNLADLLSEVSPPLPMRQYIAWIYQVIRALDYLRENGATCKRLCLRACLLTTDEQIKLTNIWSDAEDCDETWWYPKREKWLNNPVSEEAFTRDDYWRHIAPEILLGHSWTYQSLVWSISILFHQILIHRKFPNRKSYGSVVDFLTNGIRNDELVFPKTVSSKLRPIVEQCVTFKPDDRPTFAEVKQAFKAQYKLI